MKLSVIIPCYNEKPTIKQTVDAVRNLSGSDLEIIIIDDHSTDGTREILEDQLKEKIDKLVVHDKHQGQGAAIRNGLKAVTGDVVLVQAAELAYAPDADAIQTELEAAAFRELVKHLQQHTEVQNIDLMNLAGFCRNCLSRWYVAAAKEKGVEMDYEKAREIIYGMPYSEWKEKYLT